VHVISSSGEAKVRIEPVVALADSEGLKPLELRRVQEIVERQREKFRKATTGERLTSLGIA
jgi:hypothetical protein